MKAPGQSSLAYKYFMSYRLYDGQRFDETVVPYKAKRSFNKKFKRFLSNHPKLYLWLILLCSATIFGTASLASVLILVLFFFLLTMSLELYTATQPTHIALSSKGLRMYWIHWFGDKASPLIPWQKVQFASVLRRKDKLLFEDWLVFREDPKKPPLLKLRLPGISTGEHRQRLLSALRQFLPEEKIDRSIQDALNPVRLDSHTSMWLDVLASSPRRLRKEALASGNLIGNGRYRIVEPLGVGGQGTAYLAQPLNKQTDDETKLPLVVLKEFVLPAEASLKVCRNAFETIENEAELLKNLAHPKIVALLDIFVDDQRAYLVMEHAPGQSLKEIVSKNGSLPEIMVIDLALQMCEILKHLHGQNPPVIHRDFTPGNLILGPDKELKLIDFNVAQKLESSATRTVVGKHSFIPAEQFRGKATPQSDIYACGATLCYLLSAEEPEPITVAHPIIFNPYVSPELDEIIATCTQQDLACRYKSADELEQALSQLLKQRQT